MKEKLDIGLRRDKKLLRFIKLHLKKVKISKFSYKISISRKKYIEMLKNRYISCLLDFSKKELLKGISQFKITHNNQIKFTDTLKCITYQK